MHAISVLPGGLETARLTVLPSGSEWFEFDATLAPATKLRFASDGRQFPVRGTVSIRRGLDEADVDSFRYIEGCTDDDTGEQVEERFGVTLFIAEDAFDRLLQRTHWGLPALVLFFDASSTVITPDRAGAADGLLFHPRPRPWEKVASATLTQRPRAAP